jgi:hypothetical protein
MHKVLKEKDVDESGTEFSPFFLSKNSSRGTKRAGVGKRSDLCLIRLHSLVKAKGVHGRTTLSLFLTASAEHTHMCCSLLNKQSAFILRRAGKCISENTVVCVCFASSEAKA